MKKIVYICDNYFLNDHLMAVDQCEIWKDFQSGNLDELYSRFYSPLLIFAKKNLLSTDQFLAEDVVQSSIFEAWKIRNKFDNDNSLKSFLYTAVKNSIISIIRKNSSKNRYLSTVDDFEETMQSMIEEETFIQLMNAVEELPENYRRIFNLIYFEKASIREVAQQMELSEISIKKYKAKGLMLLKSKLKSDKMIEILLFFIH